MNDKNIQYISDNFISLENLSSRSGFDISQIRELIDSERIPEASYVVTEVLKIESPLGDAYEVEHRTEYFPKSYLKLLMAPRDKDNNAKQTFAKEMKRALVSNPDQMSAYENAVSSPDKLNDAIENEWGYYQKGVYGICTLNATPEEIIGKEIAVQKLKKFLDESDDEQLKLKKEEFVCLVSEYDQVSNRFAPYQRESSSRGKYVDNFLKKLNLREKIKSY